MKKVIIALIAFLLCSCNSNRDYTATIVYNIYYSNIPTVKTYTFNSTDEPIYILNSDRGSNSLAVFENNNWFMCNGHHLEKTSAPIEVISFTIKHK